MVRLFYSRKAHAGPSPRLALLQGHPVPAGLFASVPVTAEPTYRAAETPMHETRVRREMAINDGFHGEYGGQARGAQEPDRSTWAETKEPQGDAHEVNHAADAVFGKGGGDEVVP